MKGVQFNTLIGIYKITNRITNKSYIGESSNIISRWESHIRHLENKEYDKDFQEDFNKYGISSFTFEIIKILSHNFSRKERMEFESKYIEQFNAIKNGYNKKLPIKLQEIEIESKEYLSMRQYIKYLTENKYIINCKYNEIFKYLRENNYFYYDNNKNNIPNEKLIEDNYFKLTKEFENNKSYIKINVLDNGKLFLEEILLQNGLIILRQ